MNKRRNYFNNHYNADPTANVFDAVGGKNQVWNILEDVGLNVEDLDSQVGMDMEAYEYHVKEKRVYYPPYTLDPEKTTFEDIRNHAITRQNIAETTADKYLNNAKIMETHPVFPVNFKNPHWTNFFQHMDHIKRFEGATPNMLKNRRKAWSMFCRAWGTDKEWTTYKLPHIPDRSKDIVLQFLRRLKIYYSIILQEIRISIG